MDANTREAVVLSGFSWQELELSPLPHLDVEKERILEISSRSLSPRLPSLSLQCSFGCWKGRCLSYRFRKILHLPHAAEMAQGVKVLPSLTTQLQSLRSIWWKERERTDSHTL